MLCLHQAGEELTPAREEVAGSLLDTPCNLGESCLAPRIEAVELEDEPIRYPSELIHTSRLLQRPVPEGALLTAVALDTIAVGMLAVEVGDSGPIEGRDRLALPVAELVAREDLLELCVAGLGLLVVGDEARHRECL